LAVLVWFTDYTTQFFYTFFIADSPSRYYNHSLESILTPWCLVSERSLDVLSPRRLAADSWPLVGYSSTDCLSSYSSTIHTWLSQQHNSQPHPLPWKYCIAMGLYFRCVRNFGIRNQLLHSSVNNRLPGRCLGMDAPSICSIGKSVKISTYLFYWFRFGFPDICMWGKAFTVDETYPF
jgi:hypothetical protein